MHNYVVENFDWSYHQNFAQSRFLDGREGALLSNGFNNVVVLSLFFGLCWWAFGLWVEFYAIRQTLSYMNNVQRVLYLKDLAEYADDLLLLTQDHFNMVVKSRHDSLPLPVPRIRIPATINMRTMKMYKVSKSESQPTVMPGSPGDGAALAPSLDNIGVSFTMDCNRATFLSAHWGVPVSLLHDICVDTSAHIEESQTEVTYIKTSLKTLLNLFGDAHQSLLDDNETDFLDSTENYNEKLGQFNLLAYGNKLCSNEPVCYDAGTDIKCTVTPPIKTVEVNNEKRSIWEVLLKGVHKGEEIIPLVLVLYSPRARESCIFSEGSVESHQGIAEMTLVGFKGHIIPSQMCGTDAGIPSGVQIDMEKQVCFANDFSHPQEPQEMFGMGDTDNECLICITNRMDTLLLPCGHASFCFNCLKALRNEKCPVCRGVFTSYIKFPLVDSVKV
ncbi:hypothetical protein X943_001547 [Babesia divergens]|uniref:RING-type domain-containing protein n=1 Tax=Babesia divergens TaxID=32595 RepID=A0AAD9GFP2_BABDI|nr:hypothetical protein X943_001547 [Babesia divergens]